MTSAFDDFAWLFDRYFAGPYEHWQRPAIDRLLLAGLPPGARILDLCCGAGQLARRLADQGYRITGVDASKGMLQIARERVPQATFLHADAADFTIPEPADAAICGFDSLNNILTPDRLRRTFENVHAALVPGGRFVFDANTSAAYGERWDQPYAEVHPDHAFFFRGGFDRDSRIARTCVTLFRQRDHTWQRYDTELHQRPWDIAELEPLLRAANFLEFKIHHAEQDLQMPGHYAIGRIFVTAK